MASLVWDQVGTRFYESGVDRGVLYLPDGKGIPWNGLIAVNDEGSGKEVSPVYFDGVKYADVVTLGDFSGSLTAYTYPDEFLEFEGTLEISNGLFVTNQPQNRFGLSYRTKIGNDVDGNDLGYKIHVLYNVLAIPSQRNNQTLTQESSAIEFEWSITAVPGEVPGFQPSAHLILDTRHMGPLLINDIEATLYGNDLRDSNLPPISTLASFINEWVIIRITDNYDGTWTATGPDNLISMLDPTTFRIIQSNAEYLDEDTYQIGSLTY